METDLDRLRAHLIDRIAAIDLERTKELSASLNDAYLLGKRNGMQDALIAVGLLILKDGN